MATLEGVVSVSVRVSMKSPMGALGTLAEVSEDCRELQRSVKEGD